MANQNANKEKSIISPEFIQEALLASNLWHVGNDALYRLCRCFPDHKDPANIVAKFWLIGRSYAAAVERRRDKGHISNDEFYETCLVNVITKANLDKHIAAIKANEATSDSVLNAHRALVAALQTITKENKISLASKYLHFHCPNRVFMYDDRAKTSIARLTKSMRPRPVGKDQYSRFYDRCVWLTQQLEASTGRNLTPRELDSVLLYLYRTCA